MVFRTLAFVVLCLAASQAQTQPQAQPPAPPLPPDFPSWAYVMGVLPPAVPDDGTIFKLPGSEAAFTRSQTRDRFAAPDWYPGDHPAMPNVVAFGRKPAVWACAFCHRPNGAGGPENARIAGLPAEYIVQQIQDLVSGERSTAMPKRLPHALKLPIAKALTPEELREAADYFSRLRTGPTLIVKEASMVPKVVTRGVILVASEDGAQEAIGERIVEIPENPEHFDMLRDPRAKFLVYVPPGSIQKGQALARAPGGNAALSCAACHGADFRGLGNIPGLAGRSPTYVVRQLWDMKSGARNGAGAQAMKPVVATLSSRDMLELAAYLATLAP